MLRGLQDLQERAKAEAADEESEAGERRHRGGVEANSLSSMKDLELFGTRQR